MCIAPHTMNMLYVSCVKASFPFVSCKHGDSPLTICPMKT